MHTKKITILATLLTMGTTAVAQNLNQEVVIERDIRPVEREATRPSWVSPSILSTKVDGRRLSLYEYADAADISRGLPTLDVVSWADSVMRSPYRGYVALGYFPVYNAGLSAAYKFVDTRRAALTGRFDYNGATWSSDTKDVSGRFNHHTINVGLDGHYAFDAGTLAATVDYTYSTSGAPDFSDNKDFANAFIARGTQGINIFGLALDWKPKTWPEFIGHIGAGVEYGGFFNSQIIGIGSPITEHTVDPINDVTFGANTELGVNLGAGRLGVGVDARFRHVNNFRYFFPRIGENGEMIDGTDYEAYLDMIDYGSSTPGIIALTPAYTFKTKNIAGRLGLRVDIETGGLGHEIKLAPDIDIQWAPSSMFAVSVTATGGDVMNSNAELWRRSPWMSGVCAHERSHVNGDINLGLTFGSYRGFWATIRGGWTSAADWLHLVAVGKNVAWMPTNTVDGFNYGLELGYSWRDKVVITAGAEGAQHGCLYRWADNAKWAFDIAAKVRPIDRLTVELGYDARVDRFAFVLAPTAASWIDSRMSLGDTSNLHLGASYDFTSAFTAFVEAENLLNHRCYIAPYVDSKGINGLFGIQYKF